MTSEELDSKPREALNHQTEAHESVPGPFNNVSRQYRPVRGGAQQGSRMFASSASNSQRVQVGRDPMSLTNMLNDASRATISEPVSNPENVQHSLASRPATRSGKERATVGSTIPNRQKVHDGTVANSAPKKRTWHSLLVPVDSSFSADPMNTAPQSVLSDYSRQLEMIERNRAQKNLAHRMQNEKFSSDDLATNSSGVTRPLRDRLDAVPDEVHEEVGHVYDDVVELLRNAPREKAAALLKRVADGADLATLVSQYKQGDLQMQLSLTPNTIRRYEFPFVSEMPRHLYITENPYIRSLLMSAIVSHPMASEEKASWQQLGPPRHAPRASRVDGPDLLRGSEQHISYSVPYHTARVVGPRLSKLTAAPWTQVISDNRLLQQLISCYFQFSNTSAPKVHIDLFLDDMVAGRERFCSPLLVNAILASGCQSCRDVRDRSRIWLPDSLTYRFLAEARRLWDIDSYKNRSVPTIQAALILSYIASGNGMDEIGFTYTKRACEMGRDIGIFAAENQSTDVEMSKARIFTAWAVYMWQSMTNYYFRRKPYLTRPPQSPLPDAVRNPKWFGEIWLQYPRDQSIVPLQFGHKFQAGAALRVLTNELSLVRQNVQQQPQDIIRNNIISLKARLDNWLELLPDTLQPHKIIFPAHLTLHVQYLHFYIEFLQFCTDSTELDEHQKRELFPRNTLETLSQELQTRLETVIRLYYARHNFESFDPWVSFALTAIGNTAIAKLVTTTNEDQYTKHALRAILTLSAQGLRMQSLNYHVAKLAAFQLEGVMKPEDSQLVHTYCRAASIEDHALIQEHAYSQWPIPDLSKFNEDPRTIALEELVKAIQIKDTA